MKADDTLKVIRTAVTNVRRIIQGGGDPADLIEEANTLAYAFMTLDSHITEGGYLPTDWLD